MAYSDSMNESHPLFAGLRKPPKPAKKPPPEGSGWGYGTHNIQPTPRSWGRIGSHPTPTTRGA